MRVVSSLLALVLASAASVHAEVTVRAAAGGRVDVTANATPLSDVLDRLARHTGMKIVYEGPAPRQVVSVSLLGRSPAEAVHDLLEGLGLNYALLGDSAGTGVQTLLMTGAPAPVVASSGSAAPPAAPFRSRAGPPPMSGPDVMDEPEEEELEVDEEAPAAPTPADAPIGQPQAAPPAGPPGIPGLPAPFVPGGAPAPGSAPVPSEAAPPGQTAPAPPNPTFSPFPVSPFSPMAPFAPVVPITPGAPPAVPGPPAEPSPTPEEPSR
jgi:hypothetical protein